MFTHTGGNCTAYVRSDGQIEEYVTIQGYATAPSRLRDVCLVSACEVSRDPVDGDDERATCAEILAALENERSEYHLLTLRLYNRASERKGGAC